MTPSPSASPDLAPLLAAMRQPSFYPHGPAKVETLQTHISHLFLAGDRVYKLKKPVRFSFLDFSTLERRRRFCHEELRVNRALAPGVYRRVLGLRPRAGGFELCAEGDPAATEVVVEMDRLPAERMLAACLDRGVAVAADVDAIAAKLVFFYEQADAGPEVGAAGSPAAIAALMRQDFDEMARFRGRTISAADDRAIQAFCLETLERAAPLLRRRQRAGRVRDGHGDLHADNICLTGGGVVIFDRIEFNPAFRWRDVASDVAFLAMDLEYHGRRDLAEHFVSRFSAASGDEQLPRLVPLFACHRAYIRGKVDSLKSEEDEIPAAEREQAHHSAVAHFALARRLSWSYARFLVVVMGLSGTGKSSLARRLSERIGAAHFNSDVIRKQLAGLDPTSRAGAGDDAWLYSTEQSIRTYQTMLARCAAEVGAGRRAIADATFLRRADRDAARQVARDHGVPLILIECTSPPGDVAERLARRNAEDNDPSDADERVYHRQRQSYESTSEDEADEVMVADTRRPVGELVAEIEDLLRSQAAPSFS